MALDKNVIGIVHSMAYPGPAKTNAVQRGEAPERYLIDTIKKIADDPYFGGIEITRIKNRAHRAAVAQILKDAKMVVTYSAQPVQLRNEDGLIDAGDISSLDEPSRVNAVARLKECIEEAIELGATNFALVSGRDPGTSAGLKARRAAMRSLVRSLDEICQYASDRAAQTGTTEMNILLETFDRLDEPGCKNMLIGPTSDALEVVQELRSVYRRSNLWLMYDLSHMLLMKDASFDGEDPFVLRQLAPFLGHVHIGTCVLDKSDPLYGDTHPRLDYPGSAVTKELLSRFVMELQAIGYTKGIGFEIMPHGDEQSDAIVRTAKSYLDEARDRYDVNYALGGYFFRPRTFFPEHLFAAITDTRVKDPTVISTEAAQRKRRDTLTLDGRLMLLACDHPARLVTNVGSDPIGMGDRMDYLGRIIRVLIHPEVDGVMGTPDIIEDLLIVSAMMREKTGKGLLDDKVILGCMNRAGLAGASFEMDDRMTAFTAQSLHRLRLDGAKIMFRLDLNDKYSGRTLTYCASAITECNALGLPTFLEPLPVQKTDKGYEVKLNHIDMIRTIGVASALGDSSQNLWLKIPYVENYDQVAKATALPILMLGGASKGSPINTIESFEKGMGAGSNIRGALVGRNILYPGVDDPMAVAAAVSRVVHQEYGTLAAIKYLASIRGTALDALTSVL
jgi:DhnA family fructose-bisphosphate aldolase class Ia/sugar phosphate isomerase/epimerase